MSPCLCAAQETWDRSYLCHLLWGAGTLATPPRKLRFSMSSPLRTSPWVRIQALPAGASLTHGVFWTVVVLDQAMRLTAMKGWHWTQDS
jgi:hypothetical protein